VSRSKDWRLWWVKQNSVLIVSNGYHPSRKEALSNWFDDGGGDLAHGTINLAARHVVLPGKCIEAMRGSK